MSKRSNGKLSVAGFTLCAIKDLRPDADRGENATQGIQPVWSGFNDAFRAYFPGKDPVEEMRKLAEAGTIRIFPIRGGVIINTPEEVERFKTQQQEEHKGLSKKGKKALEKMGLL